MKTTGLNFIEAVKAANFGKNIKRKGKDTIFHSVALKTHTEFRFAGCQMEVDFTMEDYLAEDWEIVPDPDPPKMMTFQEAMEKVQEGKSVRRLHWVNDFICRHDDMPHATLHVGNSRTEPYIPAFTGIAATDWVIVEEK